MQAAQARDRFGIAEALRFEDTSGGLTRAIISTAAATAEVYVQGAHITAWAPRGQRPVLFTSSRSQFTPGKPIRGGVPIAFPWFGPRGGGLAGPMHGFARILEWSVEGTRLREDGALEIEFALSPCEQTRELGYGDFAARFRVAAGAALEMALEVRNTGTEAMPVEDALHTYFAVGDIHQVSVSGLEGTTYLDKTDNFQRKQRPNEPIRFAKETDQVHVNTTSACTIYDAMWQRRIVVEKSGSDTTVVWNPWIAKTASLADMAPEDWREMVCVETANAADNAISLAAGATHTLTTRIRID